MCANKVKKSLTLTKNKTGKIKDRCRSRYLISHNRNLPGCVY